MSEPKEIHLMGALKRSLRGPSPEALELMYDIQGRFDAVVSPIILKEAAVDVEVFAARAVAERDAEIEQLRAELQRVRDWIKFAANSEGGIVAEIDPLLEELTLERLEAADG